MGIYVIHLYACLHTILYTYSSWKKQEEYIDSIESSIKEKENGTLFIPYLK